MSEFRHMTTSFFFSNVYTPTDDSCVGGRNLSNDSFYVQAKVNLYSLSGGDGI